MELSQLKGLGKIRTEALRAAGIFSLRDLLYNLPVNYKNTMNIVPISELKPIDAVAVCGHFTGINRLNRFKGTSSVTAVFEDSTGQVMCVWYNQPWIVNKIIADEEVILFGKCDFRNGKRIILNPSLEKERTFIPQYRTISRVPSKIMANLIKQVLPYAQECCEEVFSQTILERYHLLPVIDAVKQLHQPESTELLQKARYRITFEKALLYQAGIAMLRVQNDKGIVISFDEGTIKNYWRLFEFAPTNAQKRILVDIANDMASEHPMSRMVQGDVGCGKTAIAFGALVICAKAGFQGAMMAPTEILAKQHYENARECFGYFGIEIGLLYSGMPVNERRVVVESIRNGKCQVVFGTQALISKTVIYHRLGLVIADEQHRFGVGQRTALIKKASKQIPNVLVMSATPIPRTLALVLYGDLDISTVDELPPGRLPVNTRIVPESKREGLYSFIKQKVCDGEQIYIVCPLVEENETLTNVKAVLSHFSNLKANVFKGLRLGLTYGEQPQQEKVDTLDAFTKGEIDILVATTVIEVGVNVPNATVIVVEDAYRFGLSQLHQLRGRVGRGSKESWCFLLSESNERIRTLVQSNDGFYIAQKDLELRGPGEIIGTQQHGHSLELDFANEANVRMLEQVGGCLAEIRSHLDYSKEKDKIELRANEYMKLKLENVSLN